MALMLVRGIGPLGDYGLVRISIYNLNKTIIFRYIEAIDEGIKSAEELERLCKLKVC